jgi:hypothetical protein
MRTFLLFAGAVCLLVAPALAQTLSLYDQEGTVTDGTPEINAAGHGPYGDDRDDWNNWKWQTGAENMFGVYGSAGWIGTDPPDDCELLIEADIELYAYQTCENHEIYFHIGNLSTATSTDKTAYCSGTLQSNNGQYIGFIIGPGKNLEGTEGSYTGRIIDGMVGTQDAWGRVFGVDIPAAAFDCVLTMSEDGGLFTPFITYGEGSHGTIQNAVWWLLGSGAPGSYTMQWKIEIEPDAEQPDGDYGFDPILVMSPVL